MKTTCRRCGAALPLMFAFACPAALAANGSAPESAAAAAPGGAEAGVPGADAAGSPRTLGTIQVYGVLAAETYDVDGSATATGTYTPLIDIPQTLQAIPIQLLRDQGAQSMADAMRDAPGVSVHQGEGNRDQIVIRGVSTKNAFYLDGLPDDTEHFRDLFNVQEIDVLQGPAAVLFGRGGAGGVVNVVTKKPLPARFLDLGLDTGSWDLRRATLDANAPLGADAAFRLNAMGEDSGGYRDHYYLRRYGVDPEARFTLGSGTTLEFGVEKLYDNRRADRGDPSRDGRPVDIGPGTFFGSPTQNFAQSDITAFHVRVEHTAGNLTLRDAFRAVRTNKLYQNLYPGGAVAADDTLTLSGYRHRHGRTGYFNEAEAEYDADTGAVRHVLLAGVDLSHEADVDLKTNAADITGVPLANPVVDGAINFGIPSRANNASARELGVYAEDQMTMGRWQALAGVRFSDFTVDARYHLPAFARTRRTDTAWSPRVGVIYQPNAHDSIYASVTRTFTPQGDNLALSLKTPTTADLAPQTAVNYEIGNKAELFGGRFLLSAALFRLDQNHVNSPDPNDPSQVVQTGAQRTRGFELSGTGNLTERLSLYAGYARLDATILDATTDGPAGARVPLVPGQQFSLWLRYKTNHHWGLGGGVVAAARAYTGFDNTVALPGYVRADAMGYYEGRGYRVALNLNNVFDIRYDPTANGNNQIMPGEPRNVELRVELRL